MAQDQSAGCHYQLRRDCRLLSQQVCAMQYRAKFLGEKDYFKIFNDAAREEGLVVIARMDINRASAEFYAQHPDWFCVDKNGDPITSQGQYFSCVNSDYYKKYIPEVLEEIIDRYHPEGFSDNSWKGLDRNKICYCRNCQDKFKTYSGLALPESVDWNDEAYRQWIRWSYECRTENWDLFNRITQAAGGEDCLWLGMLNAEFDHSCRALIDLKRICDRSKIIFSDHQSRETLSGFEQNSVNGNLLPAWAADEQIQVPESMANYVRGNRAPSDWPVHRLKKSVSGWKKDLPAAYLHGFIMSAAGQADRRQFETPVPLFQWHEKNESYLYDRTSLANVGLVWSQLNADFYGREDIQERVVYPWTGWCLALSQAQIPFLPIHADDIGKYADRVKVLILPDLAVLTDRQITFLSDFIDHGGNLVITGRTATLDEDGAL